ncbi:hypothetical protein D3C80_1984360 [compost metagenome]
MTMHGVGDHAQMRKVIPVEDDLVRQRTAIRADGTVGQRGHAHATGSDVAMEPGHLFAWNAVGGHALVGGGLDETVAQCQRTNGQRTEGGRRNGLNVVVLHG